MKPETILNAMVETHHSYWTGTYMIDRRRLRQYAAFRSRILKLFAEKDAELARLRAFRNERLRRALDEFSKENF